MLTHRTVIRWIRSEEIKSLSCHASRTTAVKHSDLLDFLVQNQNPGAVELIVEQENFLSYCFQLKSSLLKMHNELSQKCWILWPQVFNTAPGSRVLKLHRHNRL